MKRFRLAVPAIVTLFVLLASIAPAATGGPSTWMDFDEALLAQQAGARINVPNAYRTLALDPFALETSLAAAPLEFSGAEPTVFEMPMPDGSSARFLVEESPIMEPGLAARYPRIKTYRGVGLDDPTLSTRFGITERGFHAIVLSPSGTVFIDPYSKGDTAHYMSYFKHDVPRDPSLTWTCDVHTPDKAVTEDNAATSRPGTRVAAKSAATSEALGGAALSGTTLGDSTLRTYRLAQAANFEYTFFHSVDLLPSKSDAINFGIIPTINRVNGIYERDLSARLILIANLEDIVWDTPADPYTNESGINMLVENQVTLDALIGPENYDIGHVFSTGGGGVAFLGSLCDDGIPSLKAGGVTGLPAPTGDVFSVDFVAHEIGHQFGGNHTFNGTSGSCSGNAGSSTAYEPGSGSTIQAYAGICPGQNIQPNSDDYFHLISYIEMRTHMNTEADACAVKFATGNTAPEVDAGPEYTIPKQTPFTLTATGSDVDGDLLTYTWEQFDLGPANDGTFDNGSSPIFRSFKGTTDPSRTFPQISDVLANTSPIYDNLTYGEVLPTTDRVLNFRVSARDNQPNHGELTWDATQVEVVTSAGPFTVNQPDGGEVWTGGAGQSVVWDVANTNAPPVSATHVNIFLSTDGGLTFPILLAANVPNTGSATVGAPNLATTDARVKIQGAGNIFFDVSNSEFTIELGGGAPFAADDLTGTAHNTSIQIDVLANDSDPENDPLSITAVQSPTDQGGTAVVNAGGILYTPATGFVGNDTFTYEISDGTETDTGLVTVTVDPPDGGCEVQPADLEGSQLADGFAPQTGDGDPFLDNCEEAELSFSVSNTGGPDLTNVRIVDVRSSSHPEIVINTPLPATFAGTVASSCGPTQPATATFNFTGAGLQHGDTVLFEVDVTADELAPFTRTIFLQLTNAESDATLTDLSFDFEADEQGWQVVSGTFSRLPGGPPPSTMAMASSAGVDDACDLVRSPAFRLSSTSTLSLSSQHAIEPEIGGEFYDRANVGLFDPAASSRSVIEPDGGLRPYEVAAGTSNGACAANEAGWAGAGPGFVESTFSAGALGATGIGPAGLLVQLDVKYATDSLASLAGIQFDEVTITDVIQLVPDTQADDTCQQPEIDAVDDMAITDEDTPVTIPVLDNDDLPAGEFVVIASVTQGANGSVTNNGSDVTYTPNPDYNGTDAFTYTVCDDTGNCDTATVTVEVLPVPDPPVAADDAYDTDEDTPLVVPAPGVLANDSDVDGDALTASLLTGAANGMVAFNADGSFTYTPNADYSGPDSFTYEACDPSGRCDAATVSIDVGPVNDAPVAVDDAATTTEGTPVTIDVLANDADPDSANLSVSAVTQGTNGAVTNNGSDVTYTPNAGFVGTDSFTYESCDDQGLCDTANVTVTVEALPDPCGGDDDDFDSDGVRDDVDSDDDNDGIPDDADSDDDNDGIPDDADSDDDNDCIDDDFDDEGAHETQDRSSGYAPAKGAATYTVYVSNVSTFLVELVEGEAADALTIEIYDPTGGLVAVSAPAPGQALATTIPLAAGNYTVRVNNPTASAISFERTSILRQPW